MILEKYTRSSVIQHTNSEGTSFSQWGGASNKQLPPYDKIIDKYAIIHMHTERSPIITLYKKLPILIVINKVMTKNLSKLNQVNS